jgi:hypothetical protein
VRVKARKISVTVLVSLSGLWRTQFHLAPTPSYFLDVTYSYISFRKCLHCQFSDLLPYPLLTTPLRQRIIVEGEMHRRATTRVVDDSARRAAEEEGEDEAPPSRRDRHTRHYETQEASKAINEDKLPKSSRHYRAKRGAPIPKRHGDYDADSMEPLRRRKTGGGERRYFSNRMSDHVKVGGDPDADWDCIQQPPTGRGTASKDKHLSKDHVNLPESNPSDYYRTRPCPSAHTPNDPYRAPLPTTNYGTDTDYRIRPLTAESSWYKMVWIHTNTEIRSFASPASISFPEPYAASFPTTRSAKLPNLIHIPELYAVPVSRLSPKRLLTFITNNNQRPRVPIKLPLMQKETSSLCTIIARQLKAVPFLESPQALRFGVYESNSADDLRLI